MIPITGSSTRIPQYTHGSIVSFIFFLDDLALLRRTRGRRSTGSHPVLSYYLPSLINDSGAASDGQLIDSRLSGSRWSYANHFHHQYLLPSLTS